jgi:hypothetical protein
MLQYTTLEYDGGFSNTIYDESLAINAGDSIEQLSGTKEINGGES